MRLNYLISGLLEVLDRGKINLKTAVELSYLRGCEQQLVYELVFVQKLYVLDHKKAAELKEKSSLMELNESRLKQFLGETHGEKISINIFNNSDFERYIKKFENIEGMKKAIFDFLESYEREC